MHYWKFARRSPCHERHGNDGLHPFDLLRAPAESACEALAGPRQNTPPAGSPGYTLLQWHEVLAGEKAFRATGNWLPEETLSAFRKYLVGIKGPLTTPVGGGIRSLNVALRQELDLYVCLRPVRYYAGVPSPVKRPQDVNMVIFRENTEDIYAGIEFQAGSPEAKEVRPLSLCPCTPLHPHRPAPFAAVPVASEQEGPREEDPFP